MTSAARAGLRVLHVVDSGERRGAEVFTSDLVRALNSAEVEQHVAVVRGGPPFQVGYEAPTTALGANGRGIPGIGVDVRALITLRRLVSGLRPSVVQTHGGATLKYGVAAVGRHVPLVARQIGLSARWATTGPRRVAQSGLMRRAARIAAVADAVRAEVIGTFGIPGARVSTIPNGVDPVRLTPRESRQDTRSELGIASDAEVLLSVCALTWEKDPYAHLDITRRLHPDRPRLVHLIAGDGPMRSEIEEQVRRLGLAGTVFILGSRPDIADLLQASDVLLFASRSDGMEGMPGVVIEAGMLEVPVAGYAIAGVGEVVGDGTTGLLVPAGNPGALADAVRRLIDDPDLRRSFGAAARERCCSRYAIDTVARQYLDVYEALLSTQPVRGRR